MNENKRPSVNNLQIFSKINITKPRINVTLKTTRVTEKTQCARGE